MTILRDTIQMAKKDVLLEFRSKETLFAMGIFSFASVLIFSTLSGLFNLINLGSEVQKAISGAFLWFIITFMMMLGLTSVFSREIRKSSIYPLLSLSIKPQVIFLAKLVYLLIILTIIEVVTFFLAIVFLRINIQGEILLFILVSAIGTFDLAVAGCIVSFLTIYAKSKTLAIPILFFPLILPSIFIATGTIIDNVLFDDPMSTITNILILFIHAIIILVIALLAIDELISE